MKYFRNTSVNIASELIISITSLVFIAFMITGGCGGDGGNQNPSPPPVTGLPPECGSVDIDPECPAVSLNGLCSFWGYWCDFTERNPEIPEPETISTGVQPSACISVDCFTLECEESFGDPIPEVSIITLDIVELEIISDIVPAAFSGTADIDGVGFDYICHPPPIP